MTHPVAIDEMLEQTEPGVYVAHEGSPALIAEADSEAERYVVMDPVPTWWSPKDMPVSAQSWRPMTRDAAEDRLRELVFSAAQEAIVERAAAERAVGAAWMKGAVSLADAIERKTRVLEQPHHELLEAARALTRWDWTHLLADDRNTDDVVEQVNRLDAIVETLGGGR